MFFAPNSQQTHQQNDETNLHIPEEAIKRHNDNLKLLINQMNHLDESILDLQVKLGKYHSTSEAGNTSRNSSSCTKEEIIEQISKLDNSAAAILCWLYSNRSSSPELVSRLTKDVLGIVATLARVENDNLSRLLSEYLGTETMAAIVCRTNDGVRALEKYDEQGNINGSSCLHEAGKSTGKKINRRFLVLCLEDLRQYAGEFVADDPQRKLALPKPKLPSGDFPAGFLDYAVNLINLESKNLSCVTESGHGLRETLFYSLFSGLQIYETRNHMLKALPCITAGALSLDGGMIKKSGIFCLGSRDDVEVKFPVACGGSDVPSDYMKSEEMIRMMKWERANIAADMRREQDLLDSAKTRGSMTSMVCEF